MDILKSKSQSNNHPITEGFLAGGSALIVAILWFVFDAFHPMIIFVLYAISFVCLSIATLWLLSNGKTIKEFFSGRPVNFIAAGMAGLFFIFSSITLIIYG